MLSEEGRGKIRGYCAELNLPASRIEAYLRLLNWFISEKKFTEAEVKDGFKSSAIRRLSLEGIPDLLMQRKAEFSEVYALNDAQEELILALPSAMELIQKGIIKLPDLSNIIRQEEHKGLESFANFKKRYLHNFENPRYYNLITEYMYLGKLNLRVLAWLPQLQEVHVTALLDPRIKDLILRGSLNIAAVIESPTGSLAGRININQMQSTHNSSVHASATESARKLYSLYENCIEEPGIFEFYKTEIYCHIISLQDDPEIMAACIQSLPGNAHLTEQKLKAKVELEILKIAAAKRCIESFSSYQLSYRAKASEITDNQSSRWSYEDPNSKITNGQLLVLFWVAINDEVKRDRNATLTDGLRQFVEALYEIQRAGNINGTTGLDNCAEDGPPYCPSGAFNKIIEKLVSIHPDANIQVKTLETFNIALPAIVKAEAVKFLTNNYSYRKQVREKDITVIWIYIVNGVRNILREEYGNLADFSADKSNRKPTFEEAVDWGKEAELTAEDWKQIEAISFPSFKGEVISIKRMDASPSK